jgi:thiol-disulfide isomerase/thioredoxin
MSDQDTANQDTRRPRIPWLILLVVLALVLSRQILSSQLGFLRKPEPTPMEGVAEAGDSGPLIDFSIKDLSGQPVQLSDHRGEVVLVNFWATWCSPCREEMPILQEYYLDHRDEGFVLVGVNVSGRPEEVAAFVEDNGYVFPIWLDPPGNILIDLGINGLPASLLVDAEGHLHKRWIGPLSPSLLEIEVTPLLVSSQQ